jgi:hypothetical protein
VVLFNRLGKVIAGPQSWAIGWYVKVEPELNGWLILYLRDPSDPRAEAYDDYALTEEELSRFLNGWQIEWL